MSRLDEECIMAVVRNRSGMDAGEIDYSLMTAKFDKLSVGCLEDAIKTLEVLKRKCEDRLFVLKKAAFEDTVNQVLEVLNKDNL